MPSMSTSTATPAAIVSATRRVRSPSPGRWAQLGVVIVRVAQHADQQPHLSQRAAGGRLDNGEGLARLARVGVDQPGARAPTRAARCPCTSRPPPRPASTCTSATPNSPGSEASTGTQRADPSVLPQAPICPSHPPRPPASRHRTQPAAMPRDGYAQHELSAPTGSWSTTNGTFDQSSAIAPAITPAPAPPVPPATTTRPRRPDQRSAGPAGSVAQGARRRDPRVLRAAKPTHEHLVRHHGTSLEAVQDAAEGDQAEQCPRPPGPRPDIA